MYLCYVLYSVIISDCCWYHFPSSDPMNEMKKMAPQLQKMPDLTRHSLQLLFHWSKPPLFLPKSPNLEDMIQHDAPLHPLVPNWVRVESHVAASCGYLSQPRERKQEMLAIARLLCTLWGTMGALAERQGCAAGHVPHPHIAPLPHCLDRKQPFLPSSLITLCPCPCNCTNVLCSFSAG